MRNPSDNWEELRDKVLGLGDTSVRKTHYPSLKLRLTDLERMTRELQRSEAYLAEAQKLSQTGSFGWKVATDEHIWSEQSYRIFEFDPAAKPTLEQVIDRVHPEDRAFMSQSLQQAIASGDGFDFVQRLLMPDGRVKFLHVLAKVMRDASGGIEFIGAVMDITETRRAEERLRQSEAELRELIDAIPVKVFVFGPDWSPIFANRQDREYTGLSLEEAQSKDAVTKVFHPEDLKEIEDARERALSDGMQIEIEARIRRKDGQYRWFLIRDNPLRDEQGRIIRWYGTRTDIEDRKRAEAMVRQSEAELRQLIDVIPQQVIVFGADWSPLFASRRELEYSGLTLEEALSKDEVPRVLHPEDRQKILDARARASLSGTWTEVEARIRRKDGQYRWFLIRFNPLRDEHERILRWYGTRTDIEDRKRAEEALRQSETELRDLIENVPGMVFVALPGPSIAFVSRGWREYTGLSSKDTKGIGWQSVVHPEDLERHMEKWRVCSATGEPFEDEVRFRRAADGEHRWFLSRAVPLRDETGDILKWYGVLTDIEDRKLTEQALRRSETYLAEAQRLSHTGSFAYRPASRQALYWSDELFRIFGLDPQPCPPYSDETRRLVHPDDLDRVSKSCLQGFREKAEFAQDYRLLLHDGTVKHLDVMWHPVLDETGEVVDYAGTAADVTERKRAEEKIRQSEERLRLTLEATQIGAFDWDVAHDVWCASPIYYTALGYESREGPGNRAEWIDRLHPDDRDPFTRLTHDILTGESDQYEYDARLRHANGTYRWVHVKATGVEHGPDGKVNRILGIRIDITERKHAEEALHESETRFRTFVDHAADAIFMLDFEQGTIIDVNRCACESLGYSRQELIGMTPLVFDVNLDRTTFESIAGQAAEGETVLFDRHWHRRKDGSLFPVEIQTSAFWHGGRRFLLKVARDITERLRAEEAIRQSEKELRDVIQTMPSIALTNRPDGSLEFVNQRWQDYTGMSMEESTGSGWQRVIHPQDLDGYLEKRRAALASGKPYEGEFRIRCGATGKYRWFLSRVVPLRDERGNILRWYGTVTDIDDRKCAEERLQHENVALREEIDKSSMFEEIVGSSAALRAVLSRVAKVAPSDSTVLITGETGTGKELIARAIHKRSRRASQVFVSVNCASIPRDLIASELFGHEKGAFTGASQRHLGRFELADGGTIFLDEVGDLPAETQIALLRVLQEKEFQRVGGDRSIRCNVRVITATNRNLQSAIESGVFRSDLFYRLNVFPIETPPLRKRKEDIPLLVAYFIDRYTRKSGKTIKQIGKRSLELLQSYPWPGNIRELQNVIERSVILCETDIFSVDESWLSSQTSATGSGTNVGLSQMLSGEEKQAIETALRESRGRVSGSSGAAAKLGVPRSTLESRIRSLKIDKSRFKTI